ncbi:MAG: hypothetical protein NUV76_00170, partial [Candidatus Kuenenia sp.]|nr:hypothetical protein [Candidatus Kuenenia sp.]MCR4330854.1 hypothetical protein [Patescibacteria group bacterium]
VSDIFSLFDNTLRAWLIFKACVGLRRASTQRRRIIMFVFGSYLMIETIWSVGTINWGTAARHHIPSIGLLLIAAFSYVDTFSMQGRVPKRIKRLAW